MPTIQLIASILSILMPILIAIIGYWIKLFISDSKANFQKIFDKIEFLENSFTKFEQSQGYLEGKLESAEKRIEHQSLKIIELSSDLNLLKELFKRHENKI